jgi:lysophospholipase L1-like esterase
LLTPGFARQHERSLAGATGMMRRLSEAAGARYIDIQAAFAHHSGTEFTIDGAHLNSAGARLVAEVLAEHLRTVLA